MDIELLRTFLEVERTHHFGKAAERLHVTQSAVSARIRLLEETLGAPLFLRQRNNIQLTSDGLRLKKHAETIVNAWVRACRETSLQPDYSGGLAIGALWDLCEILLIAWLPLIRRELPDTMLQVESGTTEDLIRRLVDGGLDLALVFEPPRVPGVEICEVTAINLVLASTRRGQRVSEALSRDYIMVDWGATFGMSHARHFPDMPAPAIRMNLGALALHYLLHEKGAAYLAEQMLQSALGKGRLHKVQDAPIIEHSTFALFSPDSDREPAIRKALGLLKVA